jgi:hypothetical protein
VAVSTWSPAKYLKIKLSSTWHKACTYNGQQMLTEANMQTEFEDWRALSEAASQEQDPDKLMDLIERLNRALLHREVEMSRRLAVN